MMEQGPIFDKNSIGRITIKLQQLCITCGSHGNCEKEEDCPILLAKKIMSDYIQNQEQVLKDINLDKLPKKDESLQVDHNKVNEIFEIVRSLCNKCMFHVDKCFINVVYTLLEDVVGIEPKKSYSTKPSDV